MFLMITLNTMSERKKKGFDNVSPGVHKQFRGNGQGRGELYLSKERSEVHRRDELTEKQWQYLNDLQQEISEYQRNSQNLYSKLQHIEMQYQQSYEEYNNIIEPHHEDIEDEIQHIEGSIEYLTGEILTMRKEVQNKLQLRKTVEQSIQVLEKKREDLLEVACREQQKLAKLIEQNIQIEEEIHASREQYELLQEEVFELDAIGENIKKYGSSSVPSSILKLLQVQQTVLEQLTEVKDQIIMEEQFVKKLIPRQKIQQIDRQIEEYQKKQNILQELKKENQQLCREKQQLNTLKSQIQWNPSVESKQLEESREQEELKIATVEKEIANIKKKTTETQQKIEQYRYLTINKQQPAEDNNLEPPRKAKTAKKEKEPKGSNRHLLYQEIKSDLEQHKTNRKNCFSMLIELVCSWRKESREPYRIILSEKTYRLNSSHSMFFVLLIWIGLGALVYYCYQHTYRR